MRRPLRIGRLVVLSFVLGATPAPAATRLVDVSAPLYESPGGTVPVIVTAYHVPSGHSAAISATATGGATVRCRGRVWHNRRRRTASRKCYLRLPRRQGSHVVTGRADLSRAGKPTVRRAGAGRRPIRASGLPSPTPLTARRIGEIERCHNATDRVWLTFDDGGSSTQVRRILATLSSNDVRGRFFFTGAWAATNPALMRQIRAAGHLLGNHSYSHAALSEVPKAEVLRQIDRGVRATTSPRLLRPPFAAGALTSRLDSIAASRGYRLCRWTVDTYDWHGVTAARMAERVRHGDELTPPIARGGNILMHGTGRHTSTGLQRIIDAVEAKGLELEPLRRSAPASAG